MAFSYFFRDIDILQLAVNTLAERLPVTGSIDIWDAGCAFGQEPFTLAILLAEKLGPEDFTRVRILATDIDVSRRFAAFIELGVYPYDEVKRIPKHLLEKYFEYEENANTCRLAPEIRCAVQYVRNDLLELRPPGYGFHLVVSKNVLMHFMPEERSAVLARFADCMYDGGLLALGQAQDYHSADISPFERIGPLLFVKRQRVD